MAVVLYSTGCPKCMVLEKKLVREGIEFSLSNDIDVLIKKGFQTAPVLSVDDNFMNYYQALDWIKGQVN